MKSTRELVIQALENDTKTRHWFKRNFNFTPRKARQADLSQYEDYTALIVAEGMKSGVLKARDVYGQ